MISFAAKPAAVNNLVKATSQAVNPKVIGTPVFIHDHIYVPEDHRRWSISTFNASELFKKTRATSVAVNGLGQVRLAHTDIKIPDYTDVRLKSCQDPKKPNRDSADGRRLVSWGATAGVAAAGLIASKVVVRGIMASMGPGRHTMALAKTEVDISEVAEGKSMTVKWLGKPVFIRHRTPEEIAAVRKYDISKLRDPQKDEDRVKDPKWLIVLGVCTHLGCVPISGAGDYGGYYCPCHGSHYDASGRVRKGPAPMNLEVPEYTMDGNTLVIG